jgi:hypothetical protein
MVKKKTARLMRFSLTAQLQAEAATAEGRSARSEAGDGYENQMSAPDMKPAI